MKALLWKDFCLLRRQLKLYFIVLLLMAIVPNDYLPFFAGVYMALIPYNTLALDEQHHWDTLAAMLPYSTRALVLSKYVCGWLCCGCYALVATLAAWLERSIFPNAASPALILLSTCLGALFMALSLPVLFRFGVSKGRLTTVLLVAVCCGVVGAVSSLTDYETVLHALSRAPLWGIPLLVVLANAVSVPVAEKMLLKRRRLS